MKAAICIDAWKLPTFKRHLDAAGYSFTQGKGPKGTLILTTQAFRVTDLAKVLEAAERECKN